MIPGFCDPSGVGRLLAAFPGVFDTPATLPRPLRGQATRKIPGAFESLILTSGGGDVLEICYPAAGPNLNCLVGTGDASTLEGSREISRGVGDPRIMSVVLGDPGGVEEAIGECAGEWSVADVKQRMG